MLQLHLKHHYFCKWCPWHQEQALMIGWDAVSEIQHSLGAQSAQHFPTAVNQALASIPLLKRNDNSFQLLLVIRSILIKAVCRSIALSCHSQVPSRSRRQDWAMQIRTYLILCGRDSRIREEVCLPYVLWCHCGHKQMVAIHSSMQK